MMSKINPKYPSSGIKNIWFFASLSLATFASSCDGLSKQPGAPYVYTSAGANIPSGDLMTICPEAQSFRTNAETAFQDKCVTCHSAGTANSLFPLVAGTSLSNDDLDSNYRAALGQLLPTDSGILTSNPVLLNPIGNNGHAAILTGESDADFILINQWVADERNSPCVGN